MKKLLWLLAMFGFGLLGGVASAQANIAGTLYASNFAAWTVPQGNSGPFSWSYPGACTASSGGVSFAAFTIGTPIALVDTATPSNSEILTPTAVTVSNAGCSITVAPVNQHYSFYLRTGTAGLQEAINYTLTRVTVNQPASLVLVTPAWAQAGGTTGMISGAAGAYAVSVLDERSSVIVPYLWNGTNYVAQPFGSFTSLTTTGSSGPATLVGGVLNIPTPIPAGEGPAIVSNPAPGQNQAINQQTTGSPATSGFFSANHAYFSLAGNNDIYGIPNQSPLTLGPTTLLQFAPDAGSGMDTILLAGNGLNNSSDTTSNMIIGAPASICLESFGAMTGTGLSSPNVTSCAGLLLQTTGSKFFGRNGTTTLTLQQTAYAQGLSLDLVNAYTAPDATPASTKVWAITSVAGEPGQSGVMYSWNPTTSTLAQVCTHGDPACAGSTGTVTSVGMTVPSRMSVTPSTITSSGTFALTDNAQSAYTFFGNGTGSSAAPTFMSASTARTAMGAAPAANPITLNGNAALTGALYTSSNQTYAATARICLGNSITYGYSLSSPTTQRYCSLTSAALNQTLSDYAISGDQSADIFPRQITPGSYQVLSQLDNNSLDSGMFGTNDADVKGTGTYETAVFKPTHQAVEGWVLTPRALMVLPGDSGMTATGSCVATSGTLATNSNGSTVVGAACSGAGTQTISLTTYGSPIYGWYLINDGASSSAAFTVTVDGNSTGVTYYTKTSPAISTQNGTTASVAFIRITGIAAGTHSIVVTTTTGGTGIVGWGTPKNANAYSGHPVYMSHDIPNQAQSGGLATPATIAAYNADILYDDGLFLADSLDLRHVYNQKCMLGSAAEMNDQVHPNVLGHSHLSQCEIPVATQNPVPRNYANEGSGVMPPGVTQTVGTGANINIASGGLLSSAAGGAVSLNGAAGLYPLQITADPNFGIMLQGNTTYSGYSTSIAWRENTTAGSTTPAARFMNMFSKNGGHLQLGSQAGYGAGFYQAWDIDLSSSSTPGLFQYYGPFQATAITDSALGTTSCVSAVSGVLTAGCATSPAANLAGGVLGSVPYQSAANTTAFLSPNTSTTPCVIRETGTGSAGQAPVCDPAPAISAANMTNIPTPNLSAIAAASGTPTISAQPAVGSGASVSIGGNNNSGYISMVTTSTTSPSSTLAATVTFSSTRTPAPQSCILGNHGGQLGANSLYTDQVTATGFNIYAPNGLTSYQEYDVFFQCF